MGSYNINCSVTRQTISPGQPMYMQFLLPTMCQAHEREYHVKHFIDQIEKVGLEKAMDSFLDSGNMDSRLSPKGHAGYSESNWLPCGPAILGVYDDYGRIEVSKDEDTQKKLQILEEMMGLPFETIQEVATDERWLTIGIERRNSSWIPNGIHFDMPDWQLTLCKKISLTYIHKCVYDELVCFDFSPYAENGRMCENDEWKNSKQKFFDEMKQNIKVSLLSNAPRHRVSFREIEHLANLDKGLKYIYLQRLKCSIDCLEWFYESYLLMDSLSSLGVPLDRSQYGAQSENWNGWKRIMEPLQIELENQMALNRARLQEDEDFLTNS